MNALSPKSWDPPSGTRRPARKRWNKSSCSKHSTNSPICLLLDLPAELRLIIWEYALSEDKKISLPSTVPAVLTTNKQVAFEATGIYYTSNAFTLTVNLQKTDNISNLIGCNWAYLRKIRPNCLQLELRFEVEYAKGYLSDSDVDNVSRMWIIADDVLRAFRKSSGALLKQEIKAVMVTRDRETQAFDSEMMTDWIRKRLNGRSSEDVD